MPNRSRTIPNLIQGVSQQPPTARRETQSEFELNTFPTIIEGLIKRPPATFVGTILNTSVTPFVHWIQRDRNTRNVMLVTETDLTVVDVDTGEIVSTEPLAPNLITAATDKRDAYAAQTIADLTFLASREVTVGLSTTTAPVRAPEAILNVRQGSFGRGYRVIIDGVVVREMITPLGENIGETGIIATDAIAGFLNDPADPDPFPGFPDSGSVSGTPLSSLPDFRTRRRGSLIHIRRVDGQDFDIRVEDGQNNDAFTVVKGAVSRFSDLPRESPSDGFVIEITGDDTNRFEGYYVRWDNASNTWVETIEPGAPLGLDPATMPHTVSRQPDGTFVLAEADYLPRTVGNTVSAPDPAFVGRSISAMGYFRGRLGIMAGEDVFFSTSGELFGYYPETVTQFLEDAPIGFTSTALSVNEFTSMIEISERLYLFSDNAQFILETGPSFTLDQSDLLLTTQIETSPSVAPVTIGSEIFLSTTRGQNAGVTALFIDEITSTSIGEDETDHVPRYVPNGVHSFTACRPEETVFTVSRRDPNVIYVWRFQLEGRSRPQSAWTSWSLDCDEIISIECFGTTLYAFVRIGETISLLQFDISPAATDELQDYVTHLDWRVTEAECNIEYDPATDTTLILHPAIGLGPITVASRGGDTEAIGERADVEDEDVSIASGTRVRGDWSNRRFHAGLEYPFIYEFSKLYIRDQDGTAIQTGRLQIRYIRLDFTNTGYFEIETKPEGRPASRKVFEGRRADSPTARYDEPSLETGVLSQGVMGEGRTATIRLLNPSIFPCAFQTAEWEGNYNTRSRRG